VRGLRWRGRLDEVGHKDAGKIAAVQTTADTRPRTSNPMTSTQTLLYAAPSDVTLKRVRALIQQVGPESPTVEYKQSLADTVARGVAALANTYGGILLIGVTNDRKIVGVKEATIEAVAEHCAAKIDPPWVPEIVPVPLDDGSGRVVLVLRVIPGHYRRPFLVGGVAYVRHQNTTHPADWQRLADLFADASVAVQDQVWDIHRPDVPPGLHGGGADTTVDFVMRSGLNVAITREAKWRPLSERTVAAFAEGLDRSVLATALRGLAVATALRGLAVAGAPAGGLDPFRRHGFNRSRTVRLVWSAMPGGWPGDRPRPVEARATVDVPGAYGDASTHLTVHIDVVVRQSAVAEVARESADRQAQPWRVSVRQLSEIIDALLATLTGREVVTPIAGLAGVDVTAIPKPRVLHFVTQRPIIDVLYQDGLQPIPDAGVSKGAHLLADPALDLADTADRHSQVRMWMRQVALDAGLLGMEQILDRLDTAAG
jgi:Schlafen, AlbA_2